MDISRILVKLFLMMADFMNSYHFYNLSGTILKGIGKLMVIYMKKLTERVLLINPHRA